MELFREPNIDFLGKTKLALGFSVVLIVATIVSLVAKGGPKWGIDFRGGTLITVKFNQEPPINQIRSALDSAIQGEVSVQEVTQEGANEVIIGTELKDERALSDTRQRITQILAERFGNTGAKLDFNNASAQQVADRLRDPLQRAGAPLSEQDLHALAGRMVNFRDRERSGVLKSLDELGGVEGVTPRVLSTVKQEMALAPFSIRSVEVVGPKAGADMRRQALLATLYAMAGMLVYIALRFEWIAGVAAIVSLVHDTLITVGVFSWLNREIDLTIIAALLTLIGYSMNDTIVVFDRLRENQKLRFREPLWDLVNKSINQTLSRTILTAGPTLLTTIALYYLGGPVLNGIALALLVGILVGTYSSIFVASAILVWWQMYKERRGIGVATSAPAAVSNAKDAPRKAASRR
ncbi:MAG TPA: protein translocase subunit SecF [Bryobacteraceae bacterium]|nr:protein translocase subunit SecF [Bryobacteraceae bacterium]